MSFIIGAAVGAGVSTLLFILVRPAITARLGKAIGAFFEHLKGSRTHFTNILTLSMALVWTTVLLFKDATLFVELMTGGFFLYLAVFSSGLLGVEKFSTATRDWLSQRLPVSDQKPQNPVEEGKNG